MTVLEPANASEAGGRESQRRRAVRAGAVAELLESLDEGDDEALAVLPFVDEAGAPPVVDALLTRAFDRSCRPRQRAQLASLAAALSSGQEAASLVGQLQDPDEDTRATAASALGTRGHHEAVPALLEAVHDESARVRAAAVRALCDVGGPETGAALLRLLGDEAGGAAVRFDDELLRLLLQGVADAGAEQAEACLLGHVEHACVEVRLAALSALRALPRIERTDVVRGLLPDADARVRLHALAVLERHGDASDEEAVHARLADPDARVRAMARDAVRALGRRRAT